MAHNFRVQPSSVRALNDGVVEIIRVTLVLVLELVEEVEDVKGKRCRRTFDRCRKPTGTDQLNTFGRGAVAVTVSDNEAVSTRKVEYHQVMQRGGTLTRVTDVMSELNDEAERGEGGIFKEAAIPLLRSISVDNPS